MIIDYLKDKLHKKIVTKFREERKKIRGDDLAKNKQIKDKLTKFHSVIRKKKSTSDKKTLVIEETEEEKSNASPAEILNKTSN